LHWPEFVLQSWTSLNAAQVRQKPISTEDSKKNKQSDLLTVSKKECHNRSLCKTRQNANSRTKSETISSSLKINSR